MSHIDVSLLARYNSLMDPHLAAYFQNPKMRRQLRKNGLITRNGEIISENSYRQMMSRKEHQRHVRELLAQAIVHKTLDMERNRQVQIRKKLEEISKIELVRRVKGDTARKGDEDILPYLSPRRASSRPSSVPAGKTGRRKPRPVSAPSRGKNSGQWEMSALMTDENGIPLTPCDNLSEDGHVGTRGKKKKYPIEIDDKHLYSLDSQALRDYKMTANQPRGGHSPYLNNQLGPEMVPTPPSARPSARRRIQHTDRLGRPIRSRKGASTLHRKEPVMRHPERVQTLCSITLHYFGSHLKLDYERLDPRDEIVVEQQHCGGNTLTVFREKILPKSDFTFVSRRHRGYPFSLTIYIEGKVDCRLSTCCEYKHSKGARLGGAQGHFGVVHIDGASPCYRCQVNEKLKSKEEKKRRQEQEERDKRIKAEEEAVRRAAEESEQADYSDDDDHDDTNRTSTEATSETSESARTTERETEREPRIKSYADSEDENDRSSSESSDAKVQIPVEADDKNDKDRNEATDDITEDIKKDEDGEIEPLPWKTGTVPDEKGSYSDDDDFEDDKKDVIEDGRASRAAPKAMTKDRSRSSSRSSSRSRSRSSSRSRSRSRSNSPAVQNRAPPGEEKTVVVQATTTTDVKNIASDDETPRTAKSSSSDSSSGSGTERTGNDTERGIDSDRKKSPRSVHADNANNANNSDVERVQTTDDESLKNRQAISKTVEKEDDPPADKSVIVKSMAPEYSEDEEVKPSPPEQESSSEQGTLNATGQGGEDTLKALTDEMAKVLENVQKEESPVEKSETSDSSSDSSSDSDDSDSETDTHREKPKEPNYQSTTTDQETSDFAGGNDPDRVASGVGDSEALTKIGVTPGPKHEGSIRHLVAGKKDIELTSLSLSEEQVQELGEVLKDTPQVESLILRNSGITDNGLQQINKGLQRAKSLKMVNLNCNKLTDAEPICDLLLYPKAVEILLVHGNPLKDSGIKQLVSSLLSLHRSAASDEQMVEVRRKAKEVVANVMYDALHSSSLESIVTQGSSTGTNGSVAKLLAESERLTASNLSGLSLKQLDLGDCQITSEGATSLAEMIAHNLPIENLSLTGNKAVTIDGWDSIAEALKANYRITTLSLDYNNLGDGGAQVIAEALAENHSIKSIDLEGNKIGEQGARAILDAIKKQPNIQDVTLMPGNTIPPSLLQEIKDTLSNSDRR